MKLVVNVVSAGPGARGWVGTGVPQGGGRALHFFEELSAIIKDFEKKLGYNQYLQKKSLGALGYNPQFRLACANFSEKLVPSARTNARETISCHFGVVFVPIRLLGG